MIFYSQVDFYSEVVFSTLVRSTPNVPICGFAKDSFFL